MCFQRLTGFEALVVGEGGVGGCSEAEGRSGCTLGLGKPRVAIHLPIIVGA